VPSGPPPDSVGGVTRRTEPSSGVGLFLLALFVVGIVVAVDLISSATA
jgi:hypothetical protein